MSVNEALDGQCHYYLIKKKRYCRFQPKEGQKYCPEHACMMGIHGKRKRIPCPLNPSHNCYEDDLEKHVKKCNVTKAQKATQEASYYIRGINKGPVLMQSAGVPQESKKVCVQDLTSAELAAMIARVNQLYEDHVEKVETAVYEHPCVREEFCGCADGDLGKALGEQAALRKELLQQASLVGQLDELGFLSGGHCFVEMGAGKGKLSHWIQKASEESANNSFLLIERSSVRYKMDSFHKQGGAESEFKRIKIDIEDVYLGHIELVNSSNSVVVVGKHLCGGATDMGIRCAVETLGIPKTAQHSSLPISGSSDASVKILDHIKHPDAFKHTHHCSNISLSEKMSSPCSEVSENVLEINKSAENSPDMNKSSENLPEMNKSSENIPEMKKPSSENIPEMNKSSENIPEMKKSSENIPEINKSSTVSAEVSVDISNLLYSPLGNKYFGHFLEDTSDDYIQQEKLAGDEDRKVLLYSDAMTVSNCTTAHMQEGENKTRNIHKNIVMDSKRKEFDPTSSEDEQKPPAKTPKLANNICGQKLPKGIMIALCCHHTCSWATYLGQEFMLACGVSPQEFDLLTRLSSWATCARITAKSTKNRKNYEEAAALRKSSEQDNKEAVAEVYDDIEIVGTVMKAENHGTDDLINLEASKSLREQLSVPEREAIGWKCKRIIDTGRLHYLRSKGMTCFLRTYINEEFTPENVVLIAHLP